MAKKRNLNHELLKDRNLNSLEAQATTEYEAILIFIFQNLLYFLLICIFYFFLHE